MMRAALSLLVLAPVLLTAQPAGFNYDESKAPDYDLPEILVAADGSRVDGVEEWEEGRRPEILKLFAKHVYGRTPEGGPETSYELLETSEAALGGRAVRKQIAARFSPDGPVMHILLYLPADADGPVPVFLGPNFQGNHTIHSDPAILVSDHARAFNLRRRDATDEQIERERGAASSRWPVERILERGYGLATVYCGDIDPDFDDGFRNGVHPLFYEEGRVKPGPDDWGSIGAWAWGLSRALDYLETDEDVDASRVALFGHSRLGKTALWAGAQDERFALVISNDSGCGGAALSRRRFGETVQRINTSFPHWFADNFNRYNDNEDALPVDQHMLLALIAPRPLYVASAEEDLWADPNGEFLSAKLAGQVYELYGKQGLGVDEQPPVEQPIQNDVGYHVRRGGHDVTAYDWERYLDFADQHF